MSTKSPLSWRECRSPKIQKIFGLRSTPANTTHAPLKTANQAVFAYKEFFCRTCRQKNKNAAERRPQLPIPVFQQTETVSVFCIKNIPRKAFYALCGILIRSIPVFGRFFRLKPEAYPEIGIVDAALTRVQLHYCRNYGQA